IASVSTKLGINAGRGIDTTLEVGGTASISGATTLGSTLAVTGLTTFSGSASISTNFEVQGYASASQLFIGQNKQVQFSSTLASLSIPFEVSTTASAAKFIQSGPTASNSFAGSLNLSKGLNAFSYQGGGLALCGDGTHALSYNSGQFSCQTLTQGLT